MGCFVGFSLSSIDLSLLFVSLAVRRVVLTITAAKPARHVRIHTVLHTNWYRINHFP